MPSSQDADKNIDQVEFTVFDTETTGLVPESGDRIVEIAAVKLKGKEKTAAFHTLVNPHREISPAAFQVNGITAGMLRQAPPIESVMPEFLAFIQGSCLCCYNAGFDLGFLHNELRLMGKHLPGDILTVDILRMARRLLPGLQRYALWFVAQRLGVVDQQKHRALSDVELTLNVFHKLKDIMQSKGIGDFTKFFGLFGVSSQFLSDIHNQKVSQIQKAVDLGAALKISYLSASSGALTEREVIPKQIKQEKGHNYLVGYCSLRQQERSFRIDGILHLEITQVKG